MEVKTIRAQERTDGVRAVPQRRRTTFIRGYERT